MQRIGWIAWLMLVCTGRAVVFETTGDPGYNTNAPTGSLTNSGWQYQGRWQSYLGTPIAPRYFIAAKHVGGTTNNVFVWNGYTYHPVSSDDCPTGDLRIWKVAETFPRYAPLYLGTNEVDQPCVVFGRGTQRGAAVIVGGVTNGWRWGGSDNVQRWGENVVAGVTNFGGEWGEMLVATFDRGAGTNEAHLSVGDSSGALFLQEGGVWKLAGIHTTVDGPFSNAVDGTRFDACLLDMGGLYLYGPPWQFVPDGPADVPSAFYSTRIAAHTNWICSVIDFLPGDDLPVPTIAVAGSEVQVSFYAASNRLYRVERSDALTGWTTWTNNIPGTNGVLVLTDPVIGLRRFYRLGLER